MVMATYVFNHCGMTKELIQSIDKPLVAPRCAICNADMSRVYQPAATIFRTKGFYQTDK